MPYSEDPRQAVKKRMSFSQKLSKLTGIGRHRDKEEETKPRPPEKDDAQRSSTLSNASTTSEASNASTAPSDASTATSTATHALPPTREKYCTLRLTDDLAITIGDAFEPNPKSSLDDAWDFAYGPIRWPKFLRLVLVFPAVYLGEPLETLLFHADLHEVPFRMLKYERGADGDNRMMHVNGMKKLVSRGLHDALVAVRERARGNTYTVLWLDELCVNQDDPVERDAHVRLKRDIVAACTGKTAVDSALNANFKRGRQGRISIDGGEVEQTPSQSQQQQQQQQLYQTPPSAYQRPRGRNTSNASDLSGSTEIALSSRWQSRAQSVASMRTTERIGPSDSEGSSSAPDDDEDDDGSDDLKGKRPEKSSRRTRKRSPRRFKSPNPGGSKPPRISLTFDNPPVFGDVFEDNIKKDKARQRPYHVMKSQPL